jgi:diguanylate cyclase (GGDEF)-like protein
VPHDCLLTSWRVSRAVFQTWMQMKSKLPLARTMQLAFAAVVTLLLIVGVVGYRSVVVSTESARWVQHSGEVLEHLATLRSAMENIETEYLDYALSGDDTYLQLSRARLSIVSREQSTLRALTADNPAQQRRLDEMADLEQRTIQVGDIIVRVRSAQGIATAVDVIRTGQGDPVLDEFRAATSDMQSEERRLMHERNANEERRYRQSKVTLVLGSLLAIAFAVLSGWIVLRDQKQREHSEVELRRLNRLYGMVSGINALAIRVRDRDDLFRNFCRIAVEQGEFLMAWIGVIDRAANKLVPMAWAGFDEQSMINIRGLFAGSDGELQGKTLAARTIRDKVPVIVNDVQTDKNLVFRQMHIDAGVRSIAMLPLLSADKVTGVFVLYTNHPEFFDAAGMKLLAELAGNFAFALDYIEKQERIDRYAYYDALTGLANRSLFLDRVTQHILAAASAGHRLAMFVFDLERFKNFNDSLGRPAGDALLVQVAEWLTQKSGNVSLTARVGADQFAVVMPVVTYEGDVLQVLERRLAAFLSHPFRVNDVVYRIAAKVGVVMFPDDGADADTLFKNAEAAVKKAKVSGDRYLFYAQKMNETTPGTLGIENRLREALDRDEFVLHYQPKVNLATGKLTGAEALIRWNDPKGGLVLPGRFIPILEGTGLIHAVGRWALHRAMQDFQHWRSTGLPAVRISVNVSALQLRNRSFVADIEEAISITPGAAAGLELEITESLIMEDVNHSIVSLLAIRALGVTIAIDDFGTGFSSLSYLSKLPVDTLKIDRSFVADMISGAGGMTLVSVIINMAHALKLNVVAEGVETEEQQRQLRLMRCDEMQGYLFGKPVPVDVFEKKYLMAAGTMQVKSLGPATAPVTPA